MRKSSIVGVALCAAFVLALPLAAQAQMPPYPPPPPPGVAPPMPASPEAAEIARCLCLWREVQTLNSELSGRKQGFDQVRGELESVNAQLERERNYNVNDPAAVARFRELLARRDALFKRSTGAEASDVAGITSRYNSRVSEYNARCADHPRDPSLLNQVQAGLVCPAR